MTTPSPIQVADRWFFRLASLSRGVNLKPFCREVASLVLDLITRAGAHPGSYELNFMFPRRNGSRWDFEYQNKKLSQIPFTPRVTQVVEYLQLDSISIQVQWGAELSDHENRYGDGWINLRVETPADRHVAYTAIASQLEHECVHALQDVMQTLTYSRPEGSNGVEKGLSYALNPNEVDAHFRQFLRESKGRKIPLADVIRQNWTEFFSPEGVAGEGAAKKVIGFYLEEMRRRYPRLVSAGSDLEGSVGSAIRESMLKYLREMKAAYRRMYNAQKVDGKVFESILEVAIPNYEALRDGGVGLDPEWTAYVGNVEFDRADLPRVKEMARKAVMDTLNELFGDAMGMSSSFRWDTETEEEFWFMTHGYDVREAKRIVAARPRVVEALELEGVKGMASRTTGMNPDDSTVDIRFPVLVVTTPGKNLLPIDGWNRIRKAIRQGEVVVPAVFLNASESKRVSLG